MKNHHLGEYVWIVFSEASYANPSFLLVAKELTVDDFSGSQCLPRQK